MVYFKSVALASTVSAAATLLMCAGVADAGVWTSVDDAPLRSDIELLASVRVVDNVATHWPLPWAGLLDRLNVSDGLATQPDYIRVVADRLRQVGTAATRPGGPRASLVVDGTGSPAVIRGYDALGRQTLQSQASLEMVWDSTVVHLNVGAQSTNKHDHQIFVADGSYIAQRLGDTVVYAGYVPHWWGPGWISALSLSTNARPMPQVGFSRVSTAPFESRWLRWLGPWQVEFFVGVLDGPRVSRNTIYDGLRVSISPLPGLEVGFSRTDEMCGSGHTCKPLAAYFDVRNNDAHVDEVNDEATMDLRYTGNVGQLSYAVYAQFMNEDTNPFVVSGTSHLYGSSIWLPFEDGVGRLTVEYANSVATHDIWGGGNLKGYAYNNWGYLDGMRYRNRTLGFSLDSDSVLSSVQASFTDHAARTYSVTYHHAQISDLALSNGQSTTWINVVTSLPVTINEVQARISLPLEVSDTHLRLQLEGRLADDQPRPNHGRLATAELALTFGI